MLQSCTHAAYNSGGSVAFIATVCAKRRLSRSKQCEKKKKEKKETGESERKQEKRASE
jgi:hypothetical protein